MKKSDVKSYLDSTLESLKNKGVRIYVDWTDNTPGYKFNEWEMKGVPIRMEVGPRDIRNQKVVLARRDIGEKIFLSKNDILDMVPVLLKKIQDNLFKRQRILEIQIPTMYLHTKNFVLLLNQVGLFDVVGMDHPILNQKLKKILKLQLDVFLLMKNQMVNTVFYLENPPDMK